MRQKLECWKTMSPPATCHAGLWLDAFIGDQSREDNESKHRLVDQVAQLTVSDPYVQFFDRWEKTLKTYCPVSPRPAKVKTRLAVGLGGTSVLETAITLHHTYGVPYIPGSALKGLAASYVRQCLSDPQWGQWKPQDGDHVWEPGAAYRLIFGDTTSAGYITFFDALYVPGSGHGGKPLHPDVITVHHPDYYQNKNEAPADWDSPTPVPFLTATGDYLVALAAPAVADWIVPWIEQTFAILALALDQWGVGAKTSSGYGRMELSSPGSPNSEMGTASTAPSSVDLHQQAIDAVAPWSGKKVMVKLDKAIEGKGYIVSLKPGQALHLAGFIPLALAHGRTPQPGNDMNCVVRGVIEIEGTWYAELEWLRKIKKGKNQ